MACVPPYAVHRLLPAEAAMRFDVEVGLPGGFGVDYARALGAEWNDDRLSRFLAHLVHASEAGDLHAVERAATHLRKHHCVPISVTNELRKAGRGGTKGRTGQRRRRRGNRSEIAAEKVEYAPASRAVRLPREDLVGRLTCLVSSDDGAYNGCSLSEPD